MIFRNDVINCVREHLDSWYASSNHQENAIRLVDEYEERIRKEAKEECGEELLKIINEKPYGTEKNDWWLISQIRHFCFGVPRICDKKEQKNG